jgi:hypothetical protein
MVGGIGDSEQANPSLHTADNIVSRNIIHNVSQEYHASAALIIGYAKGTILTHNEIAHVSYSGISLSWGWGAASYAGNNHIIGNHVHHVMCGELLDGGCVYSLGPQPNSTVQGNYLHSQCEKYGVLYHDGGSGWWNTFDNVVADSPNAVWLLINSYGIKTYLNNGSFDPGTGKYHNVDFQPPNCVHDIFVDQETFYTNHKTGPNTTMLHCDSTLDKRGNVNCTVSNITVVVDGQWPPKAQAIIDAAGVGSARRRLGSKTISKTDDVADPAAAPMKD